MTGSQLQELQPTNERLGLIKHVVDRTPEPVCEIVAGNVPGTAIVQTAPFDDAFYTHDRLGVLEYSISNAEEGLSVEITAEKTSILTQVPGVFGGVLQAVAEAEKAQAVTITLAEGTRISDEVRQYVGDRSLHGSDIEFKIAA